MKNLRRLTAAVVLTSVLGLTAFAGQTATSPCAPPLPGQTDTPPCAAAPGDINTPTAVSTDPGQTVTPPAADSYIGIAASVFESMLSIF